MRTSRLALILVVSGIAAIGSADVAFNNFGSGDSYNSSNGWTIGGGGDQWIAMNFTSATTGVVSLVTLGLFAGANYNISINSDAGGLPGGAMESYNNIAGASSGTTVVAGGGAANLVAGTQYWVVIVPSDGNQTGAWAWANTDTGNFAYAEGGGAWNAYNSTRSAFRVETNAVPEPTSMAALGLGALALAARRRRKA